MFEEIHTKVKGKSCPIRKAQNISCFVGFTHTHIYQYIYICKYLSSANHFFIDTHTYITYMYASMTRCLVA